VTFKLQRDCGASSGENIIPYTGWGEGWITEILKYINAFDKE